MREAETRVAFIVRGVVAHAMQEAAARSLRLIEPESPASRLVRDWCELSADSEEPALSFSASNKTELLLAGISERAHLYPLGDLYASELAAFADVRPSQAVARLADLAGGLAELDAALRRLLDDRRDPRAAFGHAAHLQEPVLARLRATRFQRAYAGIIPKLGARTIGIDLFI